MASNKIDTQKKEWKKKRRQTIEFIIGSPRSDKIQQKYLLQILKVFDIRSWGNKYEVGKTNQPVI